MSHSGSFLYENFFLLLLDPILDAIQNIPHVFFHIAILKPQDMQPQLNYVFFSGPIFLELPIMAFSINLKYQLQSWTVEIYDVFVDRLLSLERVAQHLAALKLVPE